MNEEISLPVTTRDFGDNKSIAHMSQKLTGITATIAMLDTKTNLLIDIWEIKVL